MQVPTLYIATGAGRSLALGLALKGQLKGKSA